MDLASISRIHGVPREFVNRLKALYDKEKGIGFDVNKELSKKTRTLLKNFNLLSPDISEHLSLISVQYPYLILEECWKGYFTDYDLEEIIGLSYAKNILRKNGFSESEVNIIRPAIKKYWLILKRRGRQFTALEEIPTLAQWMILILAALKTRGKADRAIDKITEDLKKVSKNNMHLGNNIPLSLLISKRKSSERARQIKKMMGELNKIGFVRRLTKDVKDGNISTMLDMTLLAKYICSIKTGGAISLRLALEEHIERALAKESRLIVDLDLETLLSVDKEGSVNFKDIYFSDAINLLRTITKDRLSIRLIDFSAGKYSNKIEKALELRQFNGTASLISAEDVGFELRDEAIKIAYEGNVNKFNVRPDVITKGNDMYFEGRNVEVISAFDAVLSSLVVFCGRDFGFLHFLREFLDTMPDRYKVYENDKDLINITLPKIPDELILKEYLIKLTSNE